MLLEEKGQSGLESWKYYIFIYIVTRYYSFDEISACLKNGSMNIKEIAKKKVLMLLWG